MPKVRAFLARDAPTHLYLLGTLHESGIVPKPGQAPFAFWGDADNGQLEAMIFTADDGGIVIPAAYSLDPLRVLAQSLVNRFNLGTSMGEPALVDLLQQVWGQEKPRIQKIQRLFVASADELGPFLNPSLRLAEQRDFPNLLPLQAEREKEALGRDPLTEDRAGFELRLLNRIRNKRTYIMEAQQQVVFTIDVGTRSPFGAELEGMFTAPAHRRRGYATLSLGQLSRQLLASLPRLSLRLDDDSLPAQKVAQKVGYTFAKLQKLIIAHA